MSIKTKLRILGLVTLLGLGLILLVTIFGLNAIRDAEETAHRRESYVISLLEVKASALSTIMLDPLAQETKDVFAAAGSNIDLHGATAVKVIKRESVRDELKKMLAQWVHYNQESQAIIQLAPRDMKVASDKLLPLYNSEFKPFQFALEKFVGERQLEAAQASAEAIAVSSRIFWQLMALISLIAIANVFVVLNLSLSLQAGLRGMQQKLLLLKQGDLTQRLPSDRPDELGEMAVGVNAFVDELQHIVRSTRDSSNRVAAAAQQLSSAAAQVLKSTNYQGEATASVAASVEEFTASIDQVSDSATEAEKKAALSGECSRHAGTEVSNAVNEIRHIEQVVNDASNQIESLGNQAEEISSIINAIKEVADQTNLLALNAAIEAARAGEQGRGFAVVADEVRKLAERTTRSAQEITSMIGSIQVQAKSSTDVMRKGNQLVTEGVVLAEHAGSSMTQINESSAGVVKAISDISGVLREQKNASADIARNIERIAQMSEESTAAVSEVFDAAAHLEKLAAALQQEVARFQT
ncbi:MAG: methyl-accepting chemotaxis protein [Gallionella sp.]|jgi:methyl-accepting chemotaxis protein